MKKLFLILAPLSLALAACAAVPTVPTPVELADKTVLDERAVVGVELAYKAARLAVETGVDAGIIKGPLASNLRALDNTAYRAVQATREAYRTGNAASYDAALLHAQLTISTMVSVMEKN
jgi:hypothetical protein